jgi:hypothetical protein
MTSLLPARTNAAVLIKRDAASCGWQRRHRLHRFAPLRELLRLPAGGDLPLQVTSLPTNPLDCFFQVFCTCLSGALFAMIRTAFIDVVCEDHFVVLYVGHADTRLFCGVQVSRKGDLRPTSLLA